MKKFNRFLIGLWIIAGVLTLSGMLYAGDKSHKAPMSEESASSGDLAGRAWAYLGEGNYGQAMQDAEKCIKKYAQEAQRQQASLDTFAPLGKEALYSELNNVGACYFILGEVYRLTNKYEEAIKAYETMIDQYGFAQYWSERGWYWKIREEAQERIERIKGLTLEKKEEIKGAPKTPLVLADPGTASVIAYETYGIFENIGTKEYKYTVKDMAGLIKAAGEGIYPNSSSVLKDPEYKQLKADGLLEGSHWEYVHSVDPKKDFYRWATASEAKGVKQYYTALALEEAGLISHAIKAYYAIVVHFPQEVGWTFWHTPWYVGQAAIDKILYLTEHNPQLGIKLEGAFIQVKNGFNETTKDDEVITRPGKLCKVTPQEVLRKKPDMTKVAIVKTMGKGPVKLVQYANGHWQLFVHEKPYLIKGVTYAPTPIGESPDNNSLSNWMEADRNKNGKIDGPYDAWVDKNHNNKKDADEPVVGDFQLMKEMGCNTVRIYHQPHNVNKALLRDLYQQYGIMTVLGDYFGMYAIGSGASWYEGTDYSNPTHRENMKASVKKMVEEFKDEPCILMWMLGNENNYGVASNAKKDPATFYAFADEVAKMIKEIDPQQRPVVIGNGDIVFLDLYGAKTKYIDVFGSNVYRGNHGFGYSFWENIKEHTDRPVFISEYGCPAYMKGRSQEEAEDAQARYLKACWEDIVLNSAGNAGVGNAIGGFIFEWVDEWWKAYEPLFHDTKRNWAGPLPDGWMYEEWLGIMGQGHGQNSPYLRQLRKAYFEYKKIWNE